MNNVTLVTLDELAHLKGWDEEFKDLLDLLYFDDYAIDDETGERYKIVYLDRSDHVRGLVTEEIPVEDIIGLSENEFTDKYKYVEAFELYQAYRDQYTLEEGEEVFLKLAMELKKERENSRFKNDSIKLQNLI